MQGINNQEFDDNGVNSQIKSTFELLERGVQEIQLSEQYKDVVLVLGNTGAGKTTFTQWIAGDNDKLIAKEVAEGTGEFIIEDNNRIGNSTIKSKTIFPELVVEPKTKTAFYDCPGFSDTRSTSNEISATYFIKKVLDHAERVKLIFIVNYSSVRKGVDRQDLMKLLRHTTDLVKDVDKFGRSIAVVVSKVDNQYVRIGTSFSFIGDSKIISAIADFLSEVKHDMEESKKVPNLSDNEQKFYSSAIKFIDILLKKEGGYHTKIGIFRRPDEPGPLSNITLLREGKEHIEKLLYERLNFTEKISEDFGYTISEKSKNDINDLIDEINKRIWSNVSSISENVQKYYHDFAEQMRHKIKSFVTSGTVIDVQQLEAQTFSSKFNRGYTITSNLVEELTNFSNPVDLAGKISNYLTSLEINLFEDNILYLEKLGKYFNFLQIVSDKVLRTRPLAGLFSGILQDYTKLRENIKKDVIDTALKINKHLNYTIETIHRHYYKKMKSLEVQQLSAELRKEHDVMLTMVKEIERAVTTHELFRTMQIIDGNVSRLNIKITKNSMAIVINRKNYFNFLHVISDEMLINETLTWICPFKDAVNFLNKSEKWYAFLSSLFSKFSEYEIQKDVSKYNVANIEDWGAEEKLQGIEINENNFKKFLNKIQTYNIAEYDNIKNNIVTRLQLEELNHVLNLTLKHRLDINCIEPFIYIKGNYVSFNNIIESVFKLTNSMNVDVDRSCKDFQTVLRSERFNAIKVFALNTLFIDSSIPSIRNNITLTLIAPKWVVIGHQTISLDGFAGESHHSSTQQKHEYFTVHVIHGRSKGRDGACPGANGADGKPGGAGGPGGFFFGVGEQFVGGENLTVTANGGEGGLGQDGGDGFDGKYGDSPSLPSGSDSCNLCGRVKRINGFDCREEAVIPGSLEYSVRIKIFGKQGEKGGGGGKGGKGGKGGYPGNIVLFELNGKSNVSKHLRVGKDGRNGNDGKAGTTGNENNHDLEVICRHEWWFGTWYSTWTLQRTINHQRGSGGGKCVNAPDVKNAKITEKPKPASVMEKLDQAKIVNEYKSYVRENLNDRFTKAFLTTFLRKLENNQDVKAVYNTLGLVDELKTLEEDFHKINNNVNLHPFYQSLLDKIKEYALNPKEVGDLNQYRKVLSYLYTSTLGRIYNLQDNFESNLIVNITSYINVVQGDIYKLKDLKLARNKLDIITKYKQDYKIRIDIKIKEAKDLISEKIAPEIDNIGAEIDGKIESLINEVIMLQEKTKEEQKQLIEKKQQLETELVLQGLFTPFKVLGQVMGLFIPSVGIAGSVIEIGKTIADSLVLDSRRSTFQSAGSESDIEAVQSQIKTIRDQKVTRLQKILEDLTQGIDEYPEKLVALSLKVADIREKLSKIDENRYDFKDIHALENELKSSLQAKEDEIRRTQSVSNPNTSNALMVIDFCKKSAQISSAMFDTYSKYRNNQAQLDTLNKAIDNSENKFQELKEFEETIYNVIAPILQNVKSKFSVETQFDAKSEVSLDITKWQVQSSLSEIQSKLEQVTNGLRVKDMLLHCIVKLKDAMSILINSYNHIQDYQEDQYFSNYVANIFSIAPKDIDRVVNPELGTELKNAINDLEITIKSSIVLQKYQVAICAFKQFVFPFAHIYLKGLMLPSHLELISANKKNISLDILVYEAAKQMSEIKSKLELYKVSVTERDSSIGIGDFSSCYISSEPFFVWENNTYENEISKLLSGQEVVLKADLMDSFPNEDAIKFNTIELNFQLKNKTAQFEINNVLKGFSISMTHLGNSYYRYNDKIYQITTNSQNFWYYFERNNNNEPVRRSISYNKLKNSDFMLSPYALWKIKLINLRRNNKNITFKDLEIYKGKIDLELNGEGYFVDKGGINEDLLIDRYYTAVAEHVHLLEVHNEELDTVSPLQSNSISPKKKRETNRDTEDRDLRTVDQGPQVAGANRAANEDSNAKPSGWFSWLRLPSFNFLPVGEAAVIEGKTVNLKEHLNSDSINMPFISGRKSFKGVVSLKTPKSTEYATNNNTFNKISKNYAHYIRNEDTSSLSNNLDFSSDGSKTNNIKGRTTIDIYGNLTLGQLLIYMMFGSNKSFSCHHYITPEQEQSIKVENLAAEVVPIVSRHSFGGFNGFVGNCNHAPQWYKDMHKDEFEELVIKEYQRNEKKGISENSLEEILTGSMWIFDDETATDYGDNKA